MSVTLSTLQTSFFEPVNEVDEAEKKEKLARAEQHSEIPQTFGTLGSEAEKAGQELLIANLAEQDASAKNGMNKDAINNQRLRTFAAIGTA